MTTTPNCTILSCSDTPLAIAASVTGFYTTAVAIALSLWGWTVLVQKAPAELEALNQEVLNLDLETALLNADADVGPKSSDDSAKPDTLEDYIDRAIIRATLAVSTGDYVLREFQHGQYEQSSKSEQLDKSKKFGKSKNSGQSEQSAWGHLGMRLKWVFRGSKKAKAIIKEAAKCRSLLSTCERMLILEHIDRRDGMIGTRSDTTSPLGPKTVALKKAFANWFDGNPAPNEFEGNPAFKEFDGGLGPQRLVRHGTV